MSRIEEEKETVAKMIRLYCHKGERNQALCDSCKHLLEYAHERLSHCPFGDEKKTCRICPIHCYSKPMREQMRQVMRYAGPRMMLYHPWEALKHLWCEKFS